MKPQFLKVHTFPTASFSVRNDIVPYNNNHLHFHNEVELIHFREGFGMQFIGDSVKEFHSGDVLLIGAQLPHFWQFDESYYKNVVQPDVRVVHFKEDFWGNQFLELPEIKQIKDLLLISKRGLLIRGRSPKIIARIMDKMLPATGIDKILLLLRAFQLIIQESEYEILSSIAFGSGLTNDDRIDRIFEYSLKNYRKKITIEDVANELNMTSNYFCRFFKSRTLKTYSQFLTEIRIGIACKLLAENKTAIKRICYECGFNNQVSFHKYFKLLTKKTPLAYQKQFINIDI